MAVWLSASWYFMELVQWLVFGRQRADLRYEDLQDPEFASLLIVLVLLLALGTTPSRLFQSNSLAPPASVTLKGESWIR
jgi:NADH:ubiquinone oxidoreductase subunit 4 (subunit M)